MTRLLYILAILLNAGFAAFAWFTGIDVMAGFFTFNAVLFILAFCHTLAGWPRAAGRSNVVPIGGPTTFITDGRQMTHRPTKPSLRVGDPVFLAGHKIGTLGADGSVVR